MRHSFFAAGIVAKVVGFLCFCQLRTQGKKATDPGFMATRPKWIVPFNSRSMTGLSRSTSPILVPPVAITTSASLAPRCKALLTDTTSSLAMPRSTTLEPAASSKRRRAGLLVSMIAVELEASSARSTSSLPVDRIATVGFRCTLTWKHYQMCSKTRRRRLTSR